MILELSALRHPDAVVPALAGLLHVHPGPGVAIDDAVVAYLSITPALLVVDNCEHLLDVTAALVHRVLLSCPDVTVLATSRRRLDVPGEQVFPVATLAVPQAGAVGAAATASVDVVDAVVLFVERARRIRPDVALNDRTRPLVAEICRRLDGLPLAIELAAGQVGALGLADMRDRLDDRLDLLHRTTGRGLDGAPIARHATLRTVVDWSYALLSEAQQGFFESLAVFDGGFQLSAAEGVASGSAATAGAVSMLGHLVDASLVATTDDGGGRLRYHLLDTLRAYGREHLDRRGDAQAVRRRHRRWVLRFVESAEAGLESAQEAQFVRDVKLEFANIRSAWRGAVADGDIASAARITIALATYAQWHGNSELWSWATTLAQRDDLDGDLRIAVRGAAAQASYLQGDLPATERFAAQVGTADAAGGCARRWWAMAATHVLAMYDADYENAEQLAFEASAMAAGSPTWRVVLAGNVALARLCRGDAAAAKDALAPCRALVNNDSAPTARAWLDYVEGEIMLVVDPARAAAALDRAVETARAVGSTFVSGVATVALAAAETRTGDIARAIELFAEVIRHWQRTGMWVQQWTTLRNLAELFANVGMPEPAVILLAAADHARDAPAIAGADADRIADLSRRLNIRLGEAELTRLSTFAQSLTPAEVVAHALASIAATARPRQAQVVV